MKRRTLFGAMVGLVGGLFASRAGGADPFDHTKAERDSNGKAICRVYRADAEGVYREIDRNAIRRGDRIIMIGQDGDRLWKAEVATVGQVTPDCCPSGGFVADQSKPEENLLIGR